MSGDAKGLPRYRQVEEILHKLLETGGYRAGDRLPPEPQLARQIGVSRATLREALRSFEQQGIITRRQGVGTFVNARPLTIESGLENLESIEMLVRQRGLSLSLLARQLATEKALPKAAARLQISEGTRLVVMTSTYAIGERPVAYLLEALPWRETVALELEAKQNSVLDLLLQREANHPLSYAVAHIAPVHGTEEICRALDLEGNQPLLFIEQTVYDTVHQPRYYSRNYYLPNVFDFHLIRRSKDG